MSLRAAVRRRGSLGVTFNIVLAGELALRGRGSALAMPQLTFYCHSKHRDKMRRGGEHNELFPNTNFIFLDNPKLLFNGL